MKRQVFIMLILAVAVFTKTDNCLAQAQVGGTGAWAKSYAAG